MQEMKRKKGKRENDDGSVARWALAIALIALGLILLLAGFGSAGFAGDASLGSRNHSSALPLTSSLSPSLQAGLWSY